MVTRRRLFGALAAIVVVSALIGVTAAPAARLTRTLYPVPRPAPAWIDQLPARAGCGAADVSPWPFVAAAHASLVA